MSRLNRRTKRRYAGHWLARPISAVVFDLMHTVLCDKKGHRKLLAQIYRREFNVPTTIGNGQIIAVVDEFSARYADMNRHWAPDLRIPLLNAAIGKALNPDQFANLSDRSDELISRGSRVQKAYEEAGGDWVLRNADRDVLIGVREAGIPMYLGTNQRSVNVRRAFEDHNLGPYFRLDGNDGQVFISEEIDTWKPHLAFIEVIAKRIGVTVTDVVYVGNSPSKDAPLVEDRPEEGRVGCQVILIDRDGRYRMTTSSDEFQYRFRRYLDERRLVLVATMAEAFDLIENAYERRSRSS